MDEAIFGEEYTSGKIRNFVLTLNNYTEEETLALLNYERATYVILGKEVGRKRKTPHLQGYMELEDKTAFNTIKKLCPRMYIAKRRGTAKQAQKYCMKDQNYLEKGTISNQGKRTDIEDVCDDIKAGMSLEDIAEGHPATFVKFHRGLKELKHTLSAHRTQKPYVKWLWGETGIGKTRTSVETSTSYYIKDNTKWWDGYEQQETIIIDDFEETVGDYPDFRTLLRLLDHYRFQGETKGGHVKINSPRIIITADRPPETYWQGDRLAQMLRRINEVERLGPRSSVPEVIGNISSDHLMDAN